MSDDDLRKQLRTMEEDYVGQPLVVQQADLLEINGIRAKLGMPLVDAQLEEVGAAEAVSSKETTPSESKTDTRDHTEAHQVYEAYLGKIEALRVHQSYAKQIVKATGGAGQTPVRPLATMGTNGGPLLCDHCGKATVLEGGRFHGVTADVAWQQSPHEDWRSYILGGLVVDLKSNGTVRIYHGYPGQKGHCCTVASEEENKRRASFKPVEFPVTSEAMIAFLEDELPSMNRDERLELLLRIKSTLFPSFFDPGIGRNRPKV